MTNKKHIEMLSIIKKNISPHFAFDYGLEHIDELIMKLKKQDRKRDALRESMIYQIKKETFFRQRLSRGHAERIVDRMMMSIADSIG